MYNRNKATSIKKSSENRFKSKALAQQSSVTSIRGGAQSKKSLPVPKQERELAHESQLFNLDNEGTSQFTYPGPTSPQKSYNPNNYMPPQVKSPYS